LEKVNFFVQRTINWDDKTDSVTLIDQTLLPRKLQFVQCGSVKTLVRAIKTMQIRGAPAIGVAGAMGIALAIRKASKTAKTKNELLSKIMRDADSLKHARPTAVNLAWGVTEAINFLKTLPESIDPREASKKEIEFVKRLADKDVNANKELSALGQELIQTDASILTHCN
jgi:methylthioribose-1-phosphate isomerase